MSDRIDENINLDGLDMFEGQDETFEMITMTEEDGTQQSFYVIDGIDVMIQDTYFLLKKKIMNLMNLKLIYSKKLLQMAKILFMNL